MSKKSCKDCVNFFIDEPTGKFFCTDGMEFKEPCEACENYEKRCEVTSLTEFTFFDEAHLDDAILFFARNGYKSFVKYKKAERRKVFVVEIPNEAEEATE